MSQGKLSGVSAGTGLSAQLVDHFLKAVLLDNCVQAYALIGRDKRIKSFNTVARERSKMLFGRAMQEEDLIRDYLTDDERDHFERCFASAMAGHREELEVHVHAGGHSYWYECRYFPVYTEEGKILGICHCSTDITRRKEAQERQTELTHRLTGKNDELQSFLSATAHDLRSPVVNIKGFGGELRRSVDTLKELICTGAIRKDLQGKLLEIIDRDLSPSLGFVNSSAEKMDVLLDGLRQLSHVGRVEMAIERLDMRELFEQMVRAIRYQLDEKGIEVVIDEVPACQGDRKQITQAVGNLLDNAVKYMATDRKGRICLRGWTEESVAYYAIEDNGVGMPSTTLEKVFQVFYRLDPSGPVPGDGLGLSIVRRIVDRHNGRVWAESEQGRGSTFYFTLPGS